MEISTIISKIFPDSPPSQDNHVSKVLIMIALLLILGIFVLDVITPLTYGASFLYIIPLFLISWRFKKINPVYLALLITLLIFGGYLFQHGEIFPLNTNFLNVLTTDFVIWVVAFLLQLLNKLVEKIRSFNSLLNAQVQEKTKELNQAMVRDRAILTSIGDGLVVINNVGKVIMINDRAAMMLAVNSADVIGKNYIEVWMVEDEVGNQLSYEKRPTYIALTSGGKPTTNTYWYVRVDGKKFPVAVTITPFIIEGRVEGVVNIFRDVTKEREIDRSKNEFISIASHQLKTPASTIHWITERILNKKVGKLNSKQEEYFNDIKKY